jgi:hypothetical protein
MQSSFSNKQIHESAENEESIPKHRILKNPTTNTNFMSRRQHLQTSPVRQHNAQIALAQNEKSTLPKLSQNQIKPKNLKGFPVANDSIPVQLRSA